MSSPDISELVLDLCAKLGKDPKQVASIIIDPETVTFVMYTGTASNSGSPLTFADRHNWRL